MAWVSDPDGRLDARLNPDSVVAAPVASPFWEARLKALVERHLEETASPKAAELLSDWPSALSRFVQVCPREMLARLEQPLAA